MIPDSIVGKHIVEVGRRAKYLLLQVETGALIIHLGMSGSLRAYSSLPPAPTKHDHVDLFFEGGICLRYNDPRRFGSIHWQSSPILDHWLLAKLGPEPLSRSFSGAYLKACSRGRVTPIKNLIMDSHVVVGVGNIYANESLFRAGLRPTTRANRVSRADYDQLAESVQAVLSGAIEKGGTTLKDFVNAKGDPGYFEQSLNVYGREGKPCKTCGTLLKGLRLSQRATVYCPSCQRYP